MTRYMPNGTGVKQENIPYLMPHFRMQTLPTRPEQFALSTSAPYGQPPPNQVGNQGPNLRGPSGPPNQSSTPPNAPDLKVQPLPPQAPMFPSVRPQGYFTTRATGPPPSQQPRMAGHNQRQQQQTLFTPSPQFMHVQAAPQVNLYSVPYTTPYNNQRPTAYPPTVPVFPHTVAFTYGTAPAQSQPVAAYNYYAPAMIRPGAIPPAAPANPPNSSKNPMPNAPLPPSNHHQSLSWQPPAPPNRRRAHALIVTDPVTGADCLQDLFENNSHPPSGESSARQTPQPSAGNQNHTKEVQAAFAKQVLQAINKDGSENQQQHQHQYSPAQVPEEHHSEIQSDVGDAVHQANHVAHDQSYAAGPVHPVQPEHQIKILDQVVQSSKLQAEAKEFVLPHPTAKETPIVSANIDAVEVTLPNKLPKDRESPVKARKPRVTDHKESSKDILTATAAPTKEIFSDNKESSITIDEVKLPQELVSPSATISSTNATQVPLGSKDTVTPPKEIISQTQDKQHRPPQHQQQQQQPRKDVKELPTKVLERQDSGPTNVPAAAVAPDAKSNKNAQRSAAKPVPSGQNNQNNQKSVATAVVVPQPQPAKPASKSNKKNEINLKGANKEGTDMDAFNDNAVMEEENSNVITTQVVNNNDIINANSVPATTNSTTTPTNQANIIDVNVNIETNKKFEETTVKPAEPVSKPLIKSKIDITDIVKDKPKNIKPYGSSILGADETDKAPSIQSNDNIVQAKNDVNAKTSEIDRIDSKLPYTDGQWSPANQNGVKKYQRDFLMALRDIPASKIAPDNIPESVMADERGGRLSDGRLSMGGGRTDFAPQFNYVRNSSQKGQISSRLSGSKMDRSKGGKGSAAKPAMKVSISVREDVKLHESENAWRPARLAKGDVATDEDRKTEELYRKVRGILNKLTPQKFDTLLQQIRTLTIDNSERLQGVIDLVFEKAVDEPSFSLAYARMCEQLGLLQVPTQFNTEEKPDFVNFRKLLITRCQYEFEKQSLDESVKIQKIKEIEACTDPEKKKDLEFDFEEYFRKFRMKSVGNTRFIGELYKQNMLTQNIMMRCLSILIENKDEESLECLCKLLTTIGKELETKQVNLHPIFNQMKALADKKEAGKISSRIRFMLQDVIDLRNSKWVPRRQDLNPKMIDQIQKEAEQEQMNIQMMNSTPITQRKDDRGGGGLNQGSMNDRKGGRGGRNVTDDGWTTQNNSRTKPPSFSVQSDKFKGAKAINPVIRPEGGGGLNQGSMNDRKVHRGGRNVTDDGWMMQNNSRAKPPSFSVQSDKFKGTKAPVSDELGNPAMFRQWHLGSGSNVKPPSQQPTNTTNMYSALESLEADRRLNTHKDQYNSKGASLERSSYKYDNRGGSRSGSQHRSNDRSASMSQRSTPAPAPSVLPPQHFAPQQPMQQHRMPHPAAPSPVVATPAPQIEQIDEKQRLRRIINSLDEYVSDNCSVDEYFAEISTAVSPAHFAGLVTESYLHVLEVSQQNRLKTGALFAKLIVQGKLPLDSYCAGLEDLLSQADDLIIDIPMFWDYLADILVDLICEEALPLKRLHSTMRILIDQQHADKLLARLIKLVVRNKGVNFMQNQWQLSHLQVADFMDQNKAEAFFRDNQFEFLLGGATPISPNALSYEEIQKKLLIFLRNGRNIDEIQDWVSANVGDGVKENKFIRALATAIFEDSINKNHKLLPDRLEQHTIMLVKFVDNNPVFELECLYALQAMTHKMEQPQGLLLQICDKLYEIGTFSQESFVAWEQSQDPAEQEGKGVALKQLTSFFCQLKENDDDDESSSSEPDLDME